jgi:hypothetical protein
MNLKNYKLSVTVFLLTFLLLEFVQVKLMRPIILAEHFIKGAGWAEIIIISAYGAFVVWKMKARNSMPKWRTITWIVFSFVFFSQFIIGISWIEKFLMTGKLHLPVPMMIIAGPVCRGHLSVMTILFLSTVILTGPEGCSHNSIKYNFFLVDSEKVRNLYQILTITLHSVCIAMARK